MHLDKNDGMVRMAAPFCLFFLLAYVGDASHAAPIKMEQSGLLVRIANEKTYVGEPLILAIEFPNRTGVETASLSYEYPQAFSVRVATREAPSSSEPIQFLNPLFPGGITKNCDLREGEEHKEYLVLIGNWSRGQLEPIFRSPGEYHICVEFEATAPHSLRFVGNATVDVVLPSRETPDFLAQLRKKLAPEKQFEAAALVSLAFGSEKTQRQLRQLSSLEVVETLEELAPVSESTNYLIKNVLIKYYFYRLLWQCERSRTWGPEVASLHACRKLDRLLAYRPKTEFIPIMQRERFFFAAHLNFLLKNWQAAEEGFRKLIETNSRDYIEAIARENLAGLLEVREKVK